jgi:hypothetical protein
VIKWGHEQSTIKNKKGQIHWRLEAAPSPSTSMRVSGVTARVVATGTRYCGHGHPRYCGHGHPRGCGHGHPRLWPLVLLFQSSLTLQTGRHVDQLCLVLLAGPFRAGGRSSSICPSSGRNSAGHFSWLLFSSPLLVWISYGITDCWWIRLATDWSTASPCSHFEAVPWGTPSRLRLRAPASPSAHRPLLSTPGTLALAATCGKQVRASEVPRVKVPSGSRSTLLEAAHVSSVNTVPSFFPRYADLGSHLQQAGTCLRGPTCKSAPRVSWDAP